VTPTPAPNGEATLGAIVLYHATPGDDTPELVPYPLTPGVDTFAAIVARVHGKRVVDLMVVDPSKGPMPRWKVPFSEAPRPGHWSATEGSTA